MAWLIGLVSDTELEMLRGAGWVDEDPPPELLSEDDVAGASDMRTRAFFVDSDVFKIMTGPDWEPLEKV